MKVSVIIPVYQVESYIGACLDSVRKQTLGDLEIICIHDAGTDGSADIIRRAARADGRIRLLENETNMGLAATRNRGLKEARGTYVYFLDSDDLIRENALSELSEMAESEALDAVVFAADFLFESGALKERFQSNPSIFRGSYPDVLTGRALYKKWMEHWDWMPSQPRWFYRRSFLERNRICFQEGRLHEDETFAFDVLMRAERVRVIDRPYFIRRFRPGSIMTGRMTLKNVEDCVWILRHLASREDEFRDDPNLVRAVNFYRTKITAGTLGKFTAVTGTEPSEARSLFYLKEEELPLSVLIPVYNAAPYLRACLLSVLSQDFTDYEIICVDDGSTDGSGQILAGFERMDPRIRVLTHPRNKGQSAARNLALSEARGRYVYMLDADDLIVQGALGRLLSLCLREEPDVLGFENRQFSDDPAFARDAEAPLFTYRGAEGTYSGRDAFILCAGRDMLSPSVPTFLLRRAYIEETGLRFTEGILHEDIGFIFEMLTRARRVTLLHEACFLRRFRPGSTVTSGFSVRNAEGYLKSWQKVRELRPLLRELYGDDPVFQAALRKWSRDVLGRIRTLYGTAEEELYRQDGGTVDEATALLFDMLRETTTGRARAADILGTDFCRKLEEAGAVYICGTGQYACRLTDALSALDVEIRGVIALKEDLRGRRTFRGFRLYLPEEVPDRALPCVIALSHYNEERYREALTRCGFETILSVPQFLPAGF